MTLRSSNGAQLPKLRPFDFVSVRGDASRRVLDLALVLRGDWAHHECAECVGDTTIPPTR